MLDDAPIKGEIAGMLEESLAELDSWTTQPKGGAAPTADFMALDDGSMNASDASGKAQQTEVKELKKHSKAKTPVKTVSKALKRTPAALRQKAYALRISLGHRNKRK